MSGFRSRPANPRDRDWDRDSKPRDRRDRDRSLRDERDRDKFSRDCPAWLSRGTSGTEKKIRGTVPSRPLPIPVVPSLGNCIPWRQNFSGSRESSMVSRENFWHKLTICLNNIRYLKFIVKIYLYKILNKKYQVWKNLIKISNLQ